MLLLLVASGPREAAAHASLASTDPESGAVLGASPDKVTLSFSEPVDTVPDSYRLFDSSGLRDTLEANASGADVEIPLPADLPDGSYVVAWRVTSVDSHPISGAVLFTVGAAGGAAVAVPDAADITPAVGAVQGIGYVGLLVAVGLFWFRAFVEPISGRAVTLIGNGAVAFALIANVVLIPLTTMRVEGRSMSAIGDLQVWRDGFTSPVAIACSLVVAGLAIALAFPRRPVAVAVGGLIALASLPVVGHTRSIPPMWLMVSSDLVHGITGAAWFGGLVGLAILLVTSGRTDPAAGARAVTRFSLLAGLLVAAAALSGVMMAYRIVDGPAALTGTTYGRLLLSKLVVLLLPLVLAAWNRLQLVPAVERAPDETTAWRRLRFSVVAEASMLLVVVAITGFLVLLSPDVSANQAGTAPAAVPFEQAVDLGEGYLSIRVYPAVVGQNDVVLEVWGADGAGVKLLQDPTVELTLPDQDLGPLTFTLAATGDPGRYTGTVQIPLDGSWEVSVVTRISRFSEPVSTVTVPVSPASD